MPKPRPDIPLIPQVSLCAARCHEAQGPGADGFALALVAHLDGPLLWIAEAWRADRLNPVGLSQYADPARLLVVTPKDQTDALAVAEEALRAGAVGLVVLEVTKPLSLLAGRRLQLAAEAGGTTALCLIPEGMGSNAADTRWHCAPVFDPSDSTYARWEIIKNKTGTLSAFTVRWDDKTRRIRVVSTTGQ